MRRKNRTRFDVRGLVCEVKGCAELQFSSSFADPHQLELTFRSVLAARPSGS